MLCKACNSAKNNRMSRDDVRKLLSLENSGEIVTSWHAKPVWDLLKHSVQTDENALRLSKIMRDNRHSYMHALSSFSDTGPTSFLIFLLNLEYADRQPKFDGLRVEEHQMTYAGIAYEPRTSKYAMEQKVRRCRIALESLADYFEKKNRNAYVVDSAILNNAIEQAKDIAWSAGMPCNIDTSLRKAFSRGQMDEAEIRRALTSLPAEWPEGFNVAKAALVDGLEDVARRLAKMWSDERYVRDSLR